MLTEKALCLHPLPEDRRPLFPPMSDRRAWESIDETDRADLCAYVRAWQDQPYPMLLLSDYAAYVRTSSRSRCENPYFARRRKLIAAMMSVAMSNDLSGMPQVEDGLWCICEETTWAISAHVGLTKEHPFPTEEEPTLDLFAAQTGMILSFTLSILCDAVEQSLAARVRHEIDRRIITPFMTRNTDWWMGFTRRDLCNWTPWIVSNVMFAARTLLENPIPLYRRACVMLDAYLRCIPADGGCDEGVAYWNMASGSLLDCLELLEEAGLSLWDDEKLRNMLEFPLKMNLGGGYFVNFADCDARPVMYGERLQRAGELTQNEALRQMGQQLRGRVTDSVADVPHLSRMLQRLFHKAGESIGTAPVRRDVLLPDLQVRIVTKGQFTLCIKGGSNGESHNHNDVGTLMVYAGEHPVLIDAGNMCYTAKTFSDARYTLWNCRSMYHSVPMIGAYEQHEGVQYAAKDFCPLEDGASLDMADAYPAKAGVLSAKRTAIVTEDGVQLTDDIALQSPQPVTFVLMAREKPDVQGNIIRFDHAEMTSEPAIIPAVEEIPVTDARMMQSWPGALYRLTFASPAAMTHHLKIFIRNCN